MDEANRISRDKLLEHPFLSNKRRETLLDPQNFYQEVYAWYRATDGDETAYIKRI